MDFPQDLLDRLTTAPTPDQIDAYKRSFKGQGLLVQGWQNGKADSLHPNSIFNDSEVTFYLSLRAEPNRQPEIVSIEREAYLAGFYGRPLESILSRR